MVKNILKAIGQVIVVGLPSLFMLLWTFDAALVPGSDVFVITLIQFLFIIVFVAWIARSSKKGDTQTTDTAEG